jgi:hypothetical protein
MIRILKHTLRLASLTLADLTHAGGTLERLVLSKLAIPMTQAALLSLTLVVNP